MLAAAEALAAAGGAQRVGRLASGLQADPGWLAGISTIEPPQAALLELLGSRDRTRPRRWRDRSPTR